MMRLTRIRKMKRRTQAALLLKADWVENQGELKPEQLKKPESAMKEKKS